jgi:hypothetical protein
MNFKYLMMTAILAIGLASCSNDDDNVDGGGVVTKDPKTVSLTLKQGKINTYADGPSAVGLSPTLSDAKVFFVGGGVILHQGDVLAADISSNVGTKVFTGVPGAATEVYVVANSATITLPAVTNGTTTLAALKETLNNIESQTHPVDNVTLHGAATITNTNGNYTCAVQIAPAVSRIEISKIEAATSDVVVPLTAFQLDGIFINNTYSQLGLDYTSLPAPLTQGTNMFNYGQNDATSFVGGYLASLRDYDASGLGGTGLVKEPTAAVWGYQVFPLATATGTTIDGEAQSKVPMIILRITGATAAGHTIPNPAFLTVKKFVTDDGNATPITAFQEGKVYQISNILFGGEHLSSRPVVPTSSDITVTVTVKDWEGVAIKPEL